MLFPGFSADTWELTAGYHSPPVRPFSVLQRWLYLHPPFAVGPRLIMLIASRHPLDTRALLASPAALRETLGVFQFTSWNSWSTADAIASLVVSPDVSDSDWAVDVFMDFGPVMLASGSLPGWADPCSGLRENKRAGDPVNRCPYGSVRYANYLHDVDEQPDWSAESATGEQRTASSGSTPASTPGPDVSARVAAAPETSHSGDPETSHSGDPETSHSGDPETPHRGPVPVYGDRPQGTSEDPFDNVVRRSDIDGGFLVPRQFGIWLGAGAGGGHAGGSSGTAGKAGTATDASSGSTPAAVPVHAIPAPGGPTGDMRVRPVSTPLPRQAWHEADLHRLEQQTIQEHFYTLSGGRASDGRPAVRIPRQGPGASAGGAGRLGSSGGASSSSGGASRTTAPSSGASAPVVSGGVSRPSGGGGSRPSPQPLRSGGGSGGH